MQEAGVNHLEGHDSAMQCTKLHCPSGCACPEREARGRDRNRGPPRLGADVALAPEGARGPHALRSGAHRTASRLARSPLPDARQPSQLLRRTRPLQRSRFVGGARCEHCRRLLSARAAARLRDGDMDSDATVDACVRLLGVVGIDAAAARAALAALKPLRELLSAARAAGRRLACARSNELWQRTLAQAEATLSAQAVVTVHIRDLALKAMAVNAMQDIAMHMTTALDISERMMEITVAAWKQNPRLVAMSRRNLEVLVGKWRAGKLDALSVEERVYFMCSRDTPLRGAGARLCAASARDAVAFWPPDALDAAALRNVHDAICAVLEADAAGELFPGDMLARQRQMSRDEREETGHPVMMLGQELFEGVPISGRTPQQMEQLVRDLGLSKAQLSALSALQLRTEDETIDYQNMGAQMASMEAEMREVGHDAAARAAAAAAKYGLQRCALPACAAQEPAARTYKRCGRCGQAYYCCVEHQQADWRRHKHEDGCKKPA